MKMTKTIKRLSTISETPFKQQEIDWLNDVAKSCPDSSYLGSLLSDDLIKWVEKMIRDDIAPDLWGSMVAANLRTSEFSSQLYDAKQDYEREQRGLVRAESEVKRLRAQVEEMKIKHAREIEHQVTWRNSDADMARTWYNKIVDKLFEADKIAREEGERARKLEETVLELKARMYDLMSSEEGNEGEIDD